MGPRIISLNRPGCVAAYERTSIHTFLLPFLHSQRRAASILSGLSNTSGSYSHKKRVGRGPSSGKGKTSGRGYNGQKQHGKVPFIHSIGKHFAGGQTPEEVTHGKRGMSSNNFSIDLQPVNLSKLTSWISQNRIDPRRPITIREMHQSRLISAPKDGVKLLATGKESLPQNQPLHIITSRASAAAIAAVEGAGGKVSTRYYTPFAMRQIIKGRMDPVHSLQSRFDEAEWGAKIKGQDLYRLPDPTGRKELEYYRDPAKRGYLSWMVPEGDGPSLFFKTPNVGKKLQQQKTLTARKAAGKDKLW